MYLALKLHFTTENYDVIAQRGKVRASRAAFAKRKDLFSIRKIADNYTNEEVVNFLVANFVSGDRWGGMFDSEAKVRYDDWRKRTESLQYNFEKELDTIVHDLELNNLNNEDFTNGYGFLTQAYIVTRPYIQSILNKNQNRLPEPNGCHIDYLMNSVPTDLLYSKKIFYTKQKCFMQLLDKSDNYINKLDELFRKDAIERTQTIVTIAIFLREKRLINDNGIKRFHRFVNKIINR
jgi:hypothetical protein